MGVGDPCEEGFGVGVLLGPGVRVACGVELGDGDGDGVGVEVGTSPGVQVCVGARGASRTGSGKRGTFFSLPRHLSIHFLFALTQVG